MSEQQIVTPLKTCVADGCTNEAKAPRRYCNDHRGLETKEINDQAKEQRRLIEAEKMLEKKASRFNSNEDLTEKQAKEIVRDHWGVEDLHVIDTLYDLGVVAAELNKFAHTNEFFWTNGILQTLVALDARTSQPLPPIEGGELVDGEPCCKRKELWAIFQFSIAWRNVKEVGDRKISWEEFLQYRYLSKTDLMRYGKEILGLDFHDSHQKWADDIFIHKNPTLKPGYTQEDVKRWFTEQTPDGIRRFLLVCSRNSYKSTVQIVDSLQWVLCCPDSRIMQISAVKKLSGMFIKKFRHYWTVEDPRRPTFFQMLYPEMMLRAGDKSDSNAFQSPMSHLGLPQSTMTSSSMDSSQTGQRFDIGIFDDAEDDENSATADLRIKGMEKFDLVCKLCEPHGIIIVIGTPQNADQSETEGDLYAVILARAERASAKNEHRYLRYRIDPCWVLKPEFVDISVYDVKPHMIESLLFPTRLTYEFLMSELALGSEKDFRRQYCVEWTDAVQEVERLHFERTVLMSHVQDNREIPVPKDGIVYASGDMGHTPNLSNKQRDPSAFTIARVINNEKVYVLEQLQGWWRDSEKSQIIVDLTRKYEIQKWFIEKYTGFERLADDIHKLSTFQGVPVDIFWDPPGNVLHRKFYLLRSLEIPIARGAIKFVKGLIGTPEAWIETLFEQMEKLNLTTPSRKSSTIHDDLTESLSILCKFFRLNPDDPESKAREEMQTKEREKAELRRFTEFIYGPNTAAGIPDRPQEPAEPSWQSPIHAALSRGNFLKKNTEQNPSLSFRSAPIVRPNR